MRLPFQKRNPRSKAELVEEVRNNQRVAGQKKIVTGILEATQDVSIENLCDHLNVLSALILQETKKKTNDYTIESLNVDINAVKDSPTPDLLATLLSFVKDEKDPDGISAMLAKLGDHLGYYVSHRLKKEYKVSDISIEEIVK